ncbi:hypothetical protein CORC01_05920 [Colletotrichum orchidophilum]|uniref:Uncharacterized protein n=1 Tax=Colletotrichum orchidophilum TaxID=1209926 RepID=A0A1G4BBS6_9PEZI|nr:uncharacterized protein CORC01_05920 [Colletotrichum orchidophilum]OHE98831.1 hypothetical protein CORC01_05920 [Colletotrichum orchidophilum]
MLRLRCACEYRYNRSQTCCQCLTGFSASVLEVHQPRSNVALFHHPRTRQLNCSTSHRPSPLSSTSQTIFKGILLLLHGAQTFLVKHWGWGIRTELQLTTSKSDAQNSDHENLVHALGTFVAP